jgi:hypothetical protein
MSRVVPGEKGVLNMSTYIHIVYPYPFLGLRLQSLNLCQILIFKKNQV